MFDCVSHFRLSETPHVESIEVTDGGTGYTWAKARTVGGSGRGVRLRCVIVDGVITEIIVEKPGRGFATKPTIEITGDGTGATAEPNISGGGIVYENTTTFQDWRDIDCAEYTCRFDDADPPNELPAEERPTVCMIPPEPIPICTVGDDLGCDCDDLSNVFKENTYTIKDPPEYADYSQCVKRGFKVAFAKKDWHGRYGFVDSIAPSQQKYLVFTTALSYSYNSTIEHVDSSPDTVESIVATGTIEKTIDRYTGRNTTVTNTYSYTYTLDGVPDSSPTNPNYRALEAMLGTDGFDSKALFIDTIGSDPTMFVGSPLTASEIIAQINGWTYDNSSGPNIDTKTFTPGTVTISNNQIVIEWSAVVFASNDVIIQNATESFSITITLTSLYAPSDVIDDCKQLLSQIDLCNDGQIPWRTDVPVHNDSPGSGYYTKQEGPAFGPMISWAEDEDGNPVMRGVPNPAGYEPFFDSLHINKEYVECSGADAGNYAWVEQSQGAYCPAKYGTATAWSDDVTENMYLPGSNASFNSPPREYQICGGTTLVLDGGALWLSKWAEIYLFAFPHHNDARPCGPEDQATRDPDTIDCDTNPTGDLRWPSAPAECASVARQQGSYSVKRWTYRGTEMPSMSCEGGNITGPCSTAIFIQDEEPSGAYEGALRIDPASISFFDERRVGGDGEPFGDWALVQFHQAMVDPLWKQPKECNEEDEIVETEAAIPYEENTECADGTCAGYDGSSFNARCEPGLPLPWSYVEEE